MFDYMKGNYDEIHELGGTYDYYIIDIFRSLSTVKNREFSEFVSIERT